MNIGDNVIIYNFKNRTYEIDEIIKKGIMVKHTMNCGKYSNYRFIAYELLNNGPVSEEYIVNIHKRYLNELGEALYYFGILYRKIYLNYVIAHLNKSFLTKL